MSAWLSPVRIVLRSGARASGALETGLYDLADQRGGIGALNPFAWMRLSTDVALAAMNASRSETAAGVQANPAIITPDDDTGRRPGWGANPFRIPVPPAAVLPASLLAGKTPPRPQVLQALIDEDVNFHMFSLPGKETRSSSIAGPGSRDTANIIGFHIEEKLHRFNVISSAATNSAPLSASNIVGEPAGSTTWKWLFMPDDFVQVPGEEPPPTRMNLDQPQRFAMMNGRFVFGNGADGFSGTGAGQTTPVVLRGRRQLRVTAIGTLSGGFGRFANHDDGLFIYSGLLDAATGFSGGVTLRVADHQRTLLVNEPLPTLQVSKCSEPGTTWLTIRAQAMPSTAVLPLAPQYGQPGLTFQQEARLADFDFAVSGPKGLQCTAAVRQVIGSVASHLAFDPDIAAGTALDPLPYTAWREFSFVDALKNPIGSFTAEFRDGWALLKQTDGVKCFRFGGAGQIVRGTGRFKGMSGVITENSFAAIDPYVGSSVYTLRVDDPTGRFLSRDGVWRDIPVSEVTPLVTSRDNHAKAA